MNSFQITMEKGRKASSAIQLFDSTKDCALIANGMIASTRTDGANVYHAVSMTSITNDRMR